MSVKRFFDAVLHRDKALDAEITATVSQAVQEHECAVARIGKALCDVLENTDDPKTLTVTRTANLP